MMRGIIVGDNFYDEPRVAIIRTNGAHRVAGLMRSQGLEVEVLDFFNSWESAELEQVLKAYCPDFIGLSFGLGQLNDAQVNSFISLAKEVNPNIKIIAGGNQVLCNHIKNIDLNFKGFADGAIDDIVEYLKTGVYPNEALVKDLDLGLPKKVVDCTHYYSKFDLSNLRTNYTANDFLSPHENLTLETSRGCIFRCKFCNFPLIGKNKNDYIRTKEDLKQEIIYNYETYGISQYSITDDTFNDNEIKIDNLYEISQEIDFELKFMCYARIDLLHARPSSLDKMVKFGVKGMFLGIESLNTETSKLIGKGFAGEKLINYLREVKQKYPKLHFIGSYIIGLPKETLEQARHNINFAIDEGLIDNSPMYALHITKDTGGIDTSIFSKEWDQYGYEEMSLAEVNELLTQPKYSALKKVDYETFGKHNVIWKNEHMNYLDAQIGALQIRADIEPKTGLGGWNCFAAAYTKIPVEELLQLKRTEWDWEYVKKAAVDFVEDYKRKKISVLCNM
jgi:radical SAM superfamily enzyme